MDEAPNKKAICSFCGAADAHPMDDRFICDACYIARGSCCAEWFEDNEECAGKTPSQSRGASTGEAGAEEPF
jgi:hypothetical protein